MANKNDSGKPLDPNTDFQDIINDTTGLTGITDSHGGALEDLDEIMQRDVDAENPKGMVSTQSGIVQSKTATLKQDDPDDDLVDVDLIEESDAQLSQPAPAPNVVGESSMSGSTPDPESDDDVLEASHEVGLRMDETDESRKPLDTAADVAAAEKARRSPPADWYDQEDS